MVKNRQLTAKFIAKDLLPLFKAKPLWKGKEIQDAVKEKYKVLIRKWLAYNAKHCAFKMLHGSMREHYSKIGSYLAALKQINPTSTFNLVTAPPGFNTQDPGGMLLAAIGRDANDQMYPVAWAVVEGESNDSWEWFMEELRKCLDVQDGGKDWTLISDQQKGLVNAVYLIWKNAEHRYCARAYNEPDFNDAIKKMRAISNDAVDDFMKQNPNCFVRCFLKGNTCCDVIVSNMAETFNGTIVEARAMHIIDMLESIRLTTMTRIITKHSEMLAEDVVVCPRIQKKLDRAKKWAHKCTVFPSAYNVFQVKDFADDLAVDLNNRTCSCRKWDLTGLPKVNNKDCIYKYTILVIMHNLLWAFWSFWSYCGHIVILLFWAFWSFWSYCGHFGQFGHIVLTLCTICYADMSTHGGFYVLTKHTNQCLLALFLGAKCYGHYSNFEVKFSLICNFGLLVIL
ncbi:uncharacterized protein LOC143586392 [Bidens hawaiensis]|uniref:uncharacterized protein LOC143586392 n=1 Tax=Bidens hawaiensis TaxID=980011 RepID=UPI00404A5FFA